MMMVFVGRAADVKGTIIASSDTLQRPGRLHRRHGAVHGRLTDARRVRAGGVHQVFNGERTAEAVSGNRHGSTPLGHPAVSEMRIIITNRHEEMVPPQGAT